MPISAAAAATVVPFVPGSGRPSPPPAMRAREKALWRDIVQSMPANWFTPGCLPALTRLVTLTINAERLEATMRREHWDTSAAMKPDFPKLLSQHLQLSKHIAALSYKLRLLPSARCNTAAASVARRSGALATKPWSG